MEYLRFHSRSLWALAISITLLAAAPAVAAPDIVVTAFSVNSGSPPIALEAGGTATISYGFQNAGSSSSGLFNSRVYLSTDSTINNNDVRLIDLGSSSLGANNGLSSARTVTIPEGTAPGNYYVGILCDVFDAVDELNESNNSRFVAVTVTNGSSSKPDIAALSLSINDSTVVQGQQVTCSGQLKNNGPGSIDGWQVQIYLITNNSLSTSSDYKIGQRGVSDGFGGFSLSSGSSYNWSHDTAQIPTNIPNGQYYLIVYAYGGLGNTSNWGPDPNTSNDVYVSSTRVTVGSSYPEISVSYNGTNIVDGDTTPSTGDGTDFGGIAASYTSSRTFRITNTGNSTLSISGATVDGDSWTLSGLASSIPAGGFDDFTISCNFFDGPGVYYSTVRISSNDADEQVFDFAVKVTGFGSKVEPTNKSVSHQSGNYTLGLTVLASNGNHDWSVSDLPSWIRISPSSGFGSQSVTLSYDSNTTAQVRSATLTFDAPDYGTGPAIHVISQAAGVAEIAVGYNGTNIADGDTTPSTADGSNFGTVTQGRSSVSRTFTVRNTGTATLTTSGLSVPSGFTITEELSSSIAAGGSDTFTVRLDTASIGTKSGQISFNNNDSNENPYNFSITGTVNPQPVPEVHMIVADGDTTPSVGDGTDLGRIDKGASLSRIFSVSNTGSAPLTTNSLSVPAGFIVTEGLSATIAAGGSDTFTVRVDSSTAGTKSGQISFANNDANENPYNFSIIVVVEDVSTGPKPVLSGDTYSPGGESRIRVSFAPDTTATSSLGVSITLPTGWSYVSDDATSPAPLVGPQSGDTGTIEWAWSNPPSFSPDGYTLAATVRAPATAEGPQSFSGSVILDSGTLILDPIELEETSYHSADTNENWAISLQELLGFVTLYNHREGTTRTGEYHLEGASYSAGPGEQTGTPGQRQLKVPVWRQL